MFCCLAVLLITNTADIAKAILNDIPEREFALEGTVTFPLRNGHNNFALVDDSGASAFLKLTSWDRAEDFSAGDLVRVHGHTRSNGRNRTMAFCDELRVIAHGQIPVPANSDIRSIRQGRMDGRLVRITGTIREWFRDEIDPRWFYLSLCSDGETIYLALPERKDDSAESKALTDAKVSVVGICLPYSTSSRYLIGRTLRIDRIEDIEILHPAPTDVFSAPEIEDLRFLDASGVSSIGRRKVTGLVIATWKGNRALLRNGSNSLFEIEISQSTLPAYGTMIEAVGLPLTDLYRVKLMNAVWKGIEGRMTSPDPVTDMTANQLFTDGKGHLKINIAAHGSVIRLEGSVLDLPTSGSELDTLVIKSDGFVVPVDVSADRSALGNVTVGSLIEVTGTCIVRTENWQPHSTFPHADGLTVVIRTKDDIRILAHPPWWTTGRLMTVIGSLVAALFAILVWNRILKRVIERRSRQLLKEEIAHIQADLKLEERTRLAVELHDTFAQNLTGVALQIDAAQLAAERDQMSVMPYLESARLKMQNCRDNLRDCLWDLRSRILDEKNLNNAIRKTIMPFLEDTEAIVNCDVRCQELSDNSLHAVLCIVRELVLNATRHGKASSIEINGWLSDDRISLRIADNGNGFDPKNRPGMKDGHFGLQGTAERISRLKGTWAISSTPGAGCIIEINNLDVNG